MIPADIGKHADPQATNFAPTLTAQPSHQGGGMVGDRFLQPAAGRHAQGSETPAIGDRHLNRDLGTPGGPVGPQPELDSGPHFGLSAGDRERHDRGIASLV